MRRTTSTGNNEDMLGGKIGRTILPAFGLETVIGAALRRTVQ